MKKQQKEEEKSIINKIINNKGRRTWKIVAVAVIVIFVLIILGTIVKIYHFKSSFTKPTPTQIDYATKIATKKLQSSGGNVSAFEIRVGNRIKRMYDNEFSRSIVQVSFINNSNSHAYLIDVNSGEILLHSETDVYGTWASHKSNNHRDSIFPSMKYGR